MNLMKSFVIKNLQGVLKKMGVKGPRNTWKKRYFVQKSENPNRIYYYPSQSSTSEKGFINLEEGQFN